MLLQNEKEEIKRQKEKLIQISFEN